MTPSPIVLVTGGNRGLGRNAALALARRGADVVLTFRGNEDEAREVVAQIAGLGRKAAALQLDVGRVDSFAAFVDTLRRTLRTVFGRDRLDGLLNNAGHGLNAPLADVTPAQFDALLDVHFRGPFFLTQSLLPLISDGGAILNVSSGLARFTVPGYGAYAAMKGAMEVLTRYQAKELGARRISVNAIAPGAIATDFGGGRTRDDANVNAFVASVTAQGRAGLPEDIGPVMASLLTPELHWITGQRIEASGGMFL